MAADGLLIIGASQSGVQLAVSLRALGYDAPITLLGDEDHRPYQRPALSKEFLQGRISKEKLIHRSQEYWDEHRIRVVKNERITRVDKRADGSGTATSRSGAVFAFDRLALTVGARARPLPLPGTDLPGVLHLRNADDALQLKARAETAADVVIIGGGFIGLEAAASLQTMGKRVTVLEAGPRLVGRAVGEEVAAHLLDHHTARGIRIELGARTEAIVGDDDGVRGVRMADGRTLPADVVLIGIGVLPNTELAEQLGLECDNGIRVDACALTSDGVTVAVGDCANLPNPVPGSPPGDRVRFESVNNAIEHAKVAAYAITGRREEYAGIPWFWSNQGDLKLQIAGLSQGSDRTVVRRDDAKGRFTVLHYARGRVIAAECLNAPLDFMAVRQALGAGADVPADLAGDPSVPLKSITTAPVTATAPAEQPA